MFGEKQSIDNSASCLHVIVFVRVPEFAKVACVGLERKHELENERRRVEVLSDETIFRIPFIYRFRADGREAGAFGRRSSVSRSRPTVSQRSCTRSLAPSHINKNPVSKSFSSILQLVERIEL